VKARIKKGAPKNKKNRVKKESAKMAEWYNKLVDNEHYWHLAHVRGRVVERQSGGDQVRQQQIHRSPGMHFLCFRLCAEVSCAMIEMFPHPSHPSHHPSPAWESLFGKSQKNHRPSEKRCKGLQRFSLGR
jgi:hypothetical protein